MNNHNEVRLVIFGHAGGARPTIRRIILIFILGTMLLGCSTFNIDPTSFLLKSKQEELITIKLIPNSFLENGDNNYSFGFLITNLSGENIWFPNDMNVKIEFWDPDTREWLYRKNLTTYLPLDGSFILEPNDAHLGQETILNVFPDIPSEIISSDKPFRLRVSIMGYLMNGKKVTKEEISSQIIFDYLISKDK